MQHDIAIEKHSFRKTLLLHLLPGLLITAVFILASHPALIAKLGIDPSIRGYFVYIPPVFLAMIPFELGWLLWEGFQCNGHLSLKGVIQYQEKMPLYEYFIFVPALLIWSLLIFSFVSPLVEPWIIENIFGWVPNWLLPFTADLDGWSLRGPLVKWIAALAVLQSLAAPIVEELYFRGYLLPRISRFGGWAPLINVVLFSLYHFFSPWQNPTRILALTPLVYLVWWKKNIKVGMIAHCLLNFIGVLPVLPLLFG